MFALEDVILTTFDGASVEQAVNMMTNLFK